MADERSQIVWFKDAAKRFKVTVETLREWIMEGRFPSPRGDGNRQFYTEAELDHIVEHGFFGRWKPAVALPSENLPGKARKGTEKRGKDTENRGEEQDLPGSVN